MAARDPEAGFTLLESLIAFAVLASVITAAYVTVAEMLGRSARIATDLDLARAARSVLTEYVVTYPEMRPNGSVADRYTYRISETELDPENLQLLGADVMLVRVEVALQRREGTEAPFLMSTSTLRRLDR